MESLYLIFKYIPLVCMNVFVRLVRNDKCDAVTSHRTLLITKSWFSSLRMCVSPITYLIGYIFRKEDEFGMQPKHYIAVELIQISR